MVDNVHFWMDRDEIGFNPLEIKPKLTNTESDVDDNGCVKKVTGWLRNLFVTLRPSGLFVNGSIPKFLYGNNIFSADRHAIKEFVETVSESLGVNLGAAKVTKLEVCANLILSKPVTAYTILLGSIPYLQEPRPHYSTKYYEDKGEKTEEDKITHRKWFKVYDKIEEAKAKGVKIPNGLENANIMRLELTYNRGVAGLIKWPEVIGKTLYNADFAAHALSKLKEMYNKIEKAKDMVKEVKSAGDALKQINAWALSNKSEEEVRQYANKFRATLTKTEYKRLLDKLNTLMANAASVDCQALLDELDNEVNNATMVL